jgi:glutamate/tyrosine decarboxylase-like PLP-dependent enzyme
VKTGKQPEQLPGLEMDPQRMRELGHRVVDLVVDRWVSLRDGPAWLGGLRAELEPLLAEEPPERGRDAEEVIARAVKEVLPRAGRIDHPRFFAFIPSSPTWPSVLGDLLATGFNIFQGTWLESAGPSQLELVVLEWFRTWLGLPPSGGGVLTSGGSAASLVAVVTAREGAANPAAPVVYLSDQGHSSLERAARIAGIPAENLRRIPTDEAFRMRPGALATAIRRDREDGYRPLLVCANAGATNTGAVDPLDAIGAMAREEGLWFHVDAAYGGFAVLTPEGRASFRGIERADSVTLDPHKWLFQPYETGCLMVRDTRRLEEAFRILPEYLQDAELGREHVNFADRGVQLSRGFRALKVWMSIQMLGLAAFREAIAGAMELAREAERYIRASPVLELTAPASLGIVCFRFTPGGTQGGPAGLEALNLAIQDEIVSSGLAMMSSTRLRGAFSLRLCIMNYISTWEDVRQTLEAVERVGQRMVVGPGGAA